MTQSSGPPRLTKALQFSMASLLVVIAIVALLLAIVLERRKANQSTQTVQALAKELATHVGTLDVIDETRFSAVRVRNTVENDTLWKWRVHVPKERRCELRFSGFDVPTNGIATGEFATSPKRSVGQPIPGDGEVVIEFAIFPDDRGGWQYSCSVDNDTLFGGANRFLPDQKQDTSMSVNETPKTWTDGEHPVLLLVKYGGPKLDRLSQPRPVASHGFAVWIRDLQSLPAEANKEP